MADQIAKAAPAIDPKTGQISESKTEPTGVFDRLEAEFDIAAGTLIRAGRSAANRLRQRIRVMRSRRFDLTEITTPLHRGMIIEPAQWPRRCA